MKPKAIYKVIGYCPQENISIQDCTVLQNLEFFAQLKKELSKEDLEFQIQSVLSKLKLTNYKDTLVSELSQEGMRKLNIAISLQNDPKILILDEPTSGINQSLQPN